MRTIVFALMAVVTGCTNISSESAAAQAVAAGPGGVTVTARAADQLAVSWSPDASASAYQVFQSTAGAPFAPVATVFDSSGGQPASSWIATGLAGGEQYCYAVASTYPDGTVSSMGAAGCGTTGAPPARAVTTLIVPVTPIANDGPRAALWATIAGIGSAARPVYIPLALPVGATIVAARARVQDAGSGSQLVEQLLSTSDDSELFALVAQSAASSGAGTEQTLSVRGPFVTAPSTQYVVAVGHSANPANLVSRLYRLEIDVQ